MSALDDICSFPRGYFIFPGLVESVLSYSSAVDPLSGVPYASSTNRGYMFPVQSGIATSDAPQEIEYRMSQSGSIEASRWVWRPDSGTWRGRNAEGQVWGQHQPSTGIVASTESWCVAYADATGYHYVLAYSTGSRGVDVFRRHSSDPARDWALISNTRLDRPPSEIDSMRAISLPNGDLMLFVWVNLGATLGECDMYRVLGDGSAVYMQQAKMLSVFGVDPSTIPFRAHFDVARSGDHIRIIWIDKPEGTGAKTAETLVSTDLGGSFGELTSALGSPLVDDTNYRDATGILCLIPTSSVDGGMVVAYADPSGVHVQHAQGVAGWGGINLISFGATVELTGLSGYVEGGYTYLVSGYENSLAGSLSGIRVYRKGIADAADDTAAWESSSDTQHPLPGYLLTGIVSTRAGPVVSHMYRRVLTSAPTHPGGTMDSEVIMHYTGGWSGLPIGSDTVNGLTGSRGALQEYLSFFGQPDGVSWVVSASGTVLSNGERLAITAAIGQSPNVSATFAGLKMIDSGSAGDIGGAQGMTFRMNVGTGDVALGLTAVADTFTTVAGSISYAARMASSTLIELRDRLTATTIASITVPDMTSAYPTTVSVAVTYDPITNIITARVSSSREDDPTTWVSDTGTLSIGAATGSIVASYGQNLGAVAATDIHVYRMWISDTTTGAEMNQDAAPGTRFVRGTLTKSSALEMQGGLSASWGGVGGVQTDTWIATIHHRYGADHILEDSPQFAWRSTDSSTAQNVAFKSEGAATADTFVHDAIYLSGLTAPLVVVEYSNVSDFSVIVSTENLDTTRFSGLVIAAKVRNVIAFTSVATDGINLGELNGLLATDGINAGYIVGHSLDDAIQIVDADGQAVDVTGWGAAIDIYSPIAIKLYSAPVKARYYRIKFAIQPTPGDYFQVAARVVGVRYQSPIPLEWAQTLTESANLTKSRAKSGADWIREEGPTGRAWKGRLVGDTVRVRNTIVDIARAQAGISVRPVCLVISSDHPGDLPNHIYGRLGALSYDNAAFDRSEDAAIRVTAAGDMALAITEVI